MTMCANFKFKSKAVVRLKNSDGTRPQRGPKGTVQRREQHSTWNEYVILWGKDCVPIRVHEECLCLAK